MQRRLMKERDASGSAASSTNTTRDSTLWNLLPPQVMRAFVASAVSTRVCAEAPTSSTSSKFMSRFVNSLTSRGLAYVSSSPSGGGWSNRNSTADTLTFSLNNTLSNNCWSASEARALSSGFACSTSSNDACEEQLFSAVVFDWSTRSVHIIRSTSSCFKPSVLEQALELI
eukprot:CAMPEP_0198590524 /NCGR_PEP_ID=MMETSP1462-20131121/135776_1 /TAXON_ID=1333877 /ORGANISM="Brandtodinium nutriculum, Strain RCC3387" /LENGTH=170 /DNA_ID=CAMNT_0044322057 /DNA_START=124 /DNA_END=633 /DNA_ORIENTATION=-